MGNATEPGPKQADEHARDGVMSCLTGVRIMAAEMFPADVACRVSTIEASRALRVVGSVR
jgi:hypothetical protein